MSLTRRRFVRSASFSFAASAVLPAAFAQTRLRTSSDLRPKGIDAPITVENLVAFNGISQQTFASLVGESFAVRDSQRALGSMTLLSVTAQTPASTSTFKAQANKTQMVGHVPKASTHVLSGFALQFQGPAAAQPQGTYILQNDSIGTIPLLLVPSGPGVSPPTCTAIFNFLES